MKNRPKHSTGGSPFAACHLHGTTPTSGCPNCALIENARELTDHAHEDAQPSLTTQYAIEMLELNLKAATASIKESQELLARAEAEPFVLTDTQVELEAMLAETEALLARTEPTEGAVNLEVLLAETEALLAETEALLARTEPTEGAVNLEVLLAETEALLAETEAPTFCHDHLFGPSEPCPTCLAVAKGLTELRNIDAEGGEQS